MTASLHRGRQQREPGFDLWVPVPVNLSSLPALGSLPKLASLSIIDVSAQLARELRRPAALTWLPSCDAKRQRTDTDAAPDGMSQAAAGAAQIDGFELLKPQAQSRISSIAGLADCEIRIGQTVFSKLHKVILAADSAVLRFVHALRDQHADDVGAVVCVVGPSLNAALATPAQSPGPG